jgi:co-chaperonin GroES (HSP10)
MYDIVLVERLPEVERRSSGLFIPGKENPRMHVGRVISTGSGNVGESGKIAPNTVIYRLFLHVFISS